MTNWCCEKVQRWNVSSVTVQLNVSMHSTSLHQLVRTLILILNVTLTGQSLTWWRSQVVVERLKGCLTCVCVCVCVCVFPHYSIYIEACIRVKSYTAAAALCSCFLSAQVEVGGGRGGGWRGRGLLLSVSPVWVSAHTVYWQCTCIKLFIPADERLCVLLFGKQEAKQKRGDVWDELVCVCVFVSPVSPSGNPTPAWDDYRVYRSRQK